MTFSLHGIGVSEGYAIGRTYLLQRNQMEIAEYAIPDAIIEDEIRRSPAWTRGSNCRRSGSRFRLPRPVI